MKKNHLKKVLMLTMSLAMVVSVLAGCGSGTGAGTASNQSKVTVFTQKDAKDYKGTLSLWSFTDEFKTSHFIEQFNKVYPNIKINLTVIPLDNNAYQTKLASVLTSGSGAPDLFVSEVSIVNKFVNMQGAYEDLSKAPYNAENIVKTQVKYTTDLGRNQSDKDIRALAWGTAPGGIFYKRGLAKQYFGTDDPDQMSKIFSSWDSLIQAGKDLNTKSSGKVKLFANYSEMFNVALGSRKHAWVENNKLVIDDNMMNFVDYAKKIRTSGIDAKFNQWTAPWSASMAGAVHGTNVFCYVLPSWGLQNELAINAPKSKGDWGFAQAPSSYYWGGSWIGISTKSQNKELAWQLVKFMSSKDFQTWDAKANSDFPTDLDAEKQEATTADGKSAFAGGQNLAMSYSKTVPTITGKLVTKYDDTINSKFQGDLDLYVTGNKTKSQFLQQFKQDIKSAFPDVAVN